MTARLTSTGLRLVAGRCWRGGLPGCAPVTWLSVPPEAGKSPGRIGVELPDDLFQAVEAEVRLVQPFLQWPRFWWGTMRPSAQRTSSAWRTAMATTPYCPASARSAGSRWPTGRQRPDHSGSSHRRASRRGSPRPSGCGARCAAELAAAREAFARRLSEEQARMKNDPGFEHAASEELSRREVDQPLGRKLRRELHEQAGPY